MSAGSVKELGVKLPLANKSPEIIREFMISWHYLGFSKIKCNHFYILGVLPNTTLSPIIPTTGIQSYI
jgi:hypothetical protein